MHHLFDNYVFITENRQTGKSKFNYNLKKILQ